MQHYTVYVFVDYEGNDEIVVELAGHASRSLLIPWIWDKFQNSIHIINSQ